MEGKAEVIADLERMREPLLFFGTHPEAPLKASHLSLVVCSIDHARILIRKWHSRLPITQPSPWRFAFAAEYQGVTYAVALWNNPSARTLPGHWLELRRMAVSNDAPHCAASWFLGAMLRFFRTNQKSAEKLISYQDCDVHQGTIYKAAGWRVAYVSKPRVRDRSTKRPSGRMYRWNINSAAPDAAGKARWEICL